MAVVVGVSKKATTPARVPTILRLLLLFCLNDLPCLFLHFIAFSHACSLLPLLCVFSMHTTWLETRVNIVFVLFLSSIFAWPLPVPELSFSIIVLSHLLYEFDGCWLLRTTTGKNGVSYSIQNATWHGDLLRPLLNKSKSHISTLFQYEATMRSSSGLFRSVYVYKCVIYTHICVRRLYLWKHWLSSHFISPWILGSTILMASIKYECACVFLCKYWSQTPSIHNNSKRRLWLLLNKLIFFLKSQQQPFTSSA